MKRLIISLLCLGLVVAASFFGIRFVNSTYDRLTEMLEEVEKLTARENFEEAKKLCEKAEKLYVKREKWLSAFVNRGDLNEIGISISAVAPLASKESEAEFLSALSEAKTALKHLKNDQSPSPENLF